MTVRHAALTAVLALAAHPAVSSSQAVEPRTPVERTELGGRLHLQWNTTSAEQGSRSEFVLRRARIWVGTWVNDWIDGAVQVDAAGGSASARYAFVRLSLSPAARISFGQLKRAFDVFELTSSADVLVVERDGDVRGAFDCAGVGGVCSYSRFSEKLLFSSLDVGAFLEGESAGGKLAYLLSATNGPGLNAADENGAKSVSGRVEWLLLPESRLGMNAGLHDYPNPATLRDAHARAMALDLEVGDFAKGFHLQAGVMTGENWLNLDGQGKASRFLTWQGIATYRIPVDGDGRVRAVEPLGRVTWADPNQRAASDGGLVLTPGLVLHFQGKNKMGANLDLWRPQAGGTVWGLKAQTYLYF